MTDCFKQYYGLGMPSFYGGQTPTALSSQRNRPTLNTKQPAQAWCTAGCNSNNAAAFVYTDAFPNQDCFKQSPLRFLDG
jgi:hypothetical protein